MLPSSAERYLTDESTKSSGRLKILSRVRFKSVRFRILSCQNDLRSSSDQYFRSLRRSLRRVGVEGSNRYEYPLKCPSSNTCVVHSVISSQPEVVPTSYFKGQTRCWRLKSRFNGGRHEN